MNLFCASLLIAAATAAGPKLTKGYFSKVEVYPGQSYGAYSFKMDFDQELYLKNKTTGALTKLTDETMLAEDSFDIWGYGYKTLFPHISVLTLGALELTCTRKGQSYPEFNTIYYNSISAYEQRLYSFPLKVTPPNAVPVESYQRQNYGNYGSVPVNYTLYPNRISAFLNYQFEDDSNTDCSFTGHNPSSDAVFTNAAGEEIHFPFTFSYQENQCSEENTLAISEYLKAVSDIAATYSSTYQIWMLNSFFNLLQTKEGFSACQNLVDEFVSTKNTTITISDSIDCRYEYGDPLYDTDPCCSWTARQYQCCKPYSYFQTVSVADGLNSEAINSECASPYQVEATLVQAASAFNAKHELNGFSYQKFYADYSFYNSFTRTCYTKVYQQKSCTKNSDCPYSKCGSRGFCFIDYYNSAPSLLKCFISEMKPELLAVIQKSLNVAAIFSSESEKAQALAEAAVERYAVETCVGPNSWNHGTSFQYVLNITSGNYERQLVSGNRTGCLEYGQCSIEPYNRNTRESCLSSFTPACMDCDPDYGYCWQQSRPGSCDFYLSSMTTASFNAQCANLNGTVRDPGTSWSKCSLESRSQSKADCYSGFEDSCYKIGNETQWCYSVCVDRSISDWTVCSNAGNAAGKYSYINWNGMCQFSAYDEASCLEVGGNATFISPPSFSEPYLNDESSCEVPLCTYWNADRTNSTLCGQNGWCSEPCPACVFGNFYGKDGACIDSNILTSSDCSTQSGQWNDYSNSASNTTACSLYNLDTSEKCSSANKTWITPSMGTNSSSCASFYPLVTGAYWSYWQSCPDREACTSKGGSCSDYEYGTTGICLYAANTSTLYNPTCSDSYDYVFWNTGTHCVKSSITTESGCLAAGHEWKTRATNITECENKNPYCIARDGSWINTDTEGCLACGGTQYPRYSWNSPYWTTASMSAYNWVSQPEWTSSNNWTKSVDHNMLYYIMDDAIGTLLVNQYLEKYNKYYGVLASAFNAIACSCYSLNSASVCFTPESLTSNAGKCDKNPLAPSSCYGLSYNSSSFNSTDVVSIEVLVSNPAAYMADSTANVSDSSASLSVFSRTKNTKFGLKSRSKKTKSKKIVSTAAYSVVLNDNGGLSGMMIGNAYTYKSNSGTIANSTICVNVDQSIPQNKTAFPEYDIGLLINSKFVAQYSPNAYYTGTQICGTVSAFQNASFAPIMRTTDRSSKSSVVIPEDSYLPDLTTTGASSATSSTASGSTTASANNSPKVSGASSQFPSIAAFFSLFLMFSFL